MKTVIGLDIPTESTAVNLRFTYHVGDGPPLQEGERLEFSDGKGDGLVMIINLVSRLHEAGERYILADADIQDTWNLQGVVSILRASTFVGEMNVDDVAIPAA